MRRKFRVVGLINENSEILGTTYGQVKEVINAGFKEEFERLESARGLTTSYAPVEHQLHAVTDLKLGMAQVLSEDQQRGAEHFKSTSFLIEDWSAVHEQLSGARPLEHAVAVAGGVASKLAAPSGVQQVNGLQGTRLVADATVDVSFDADAGRVVMKDKPSPVANLSRGLGRRAEDKDHSY